MSALEALDFTLPITAGNIIEEEESKTNESVATTKF